MSADAPSLERRVLESLAAALPRSERPPLCVALSGGLDSTVLLSILARHAVLRRRLRAVHVDHGLQPRSHAWAAQCRALAARLRVPLTVLAVRIERVRGESLEALARAARYAALAGELTPGEVLLTAQHADDQLETVLLQLTRGAGLPGLAAMPVCAPFARGTLVRPLLAITRAELEAWARRKRLTFVEDDSNADERLDRNYLRRRVLPALRARWPQAAHTVARSARHAAEGQHMLDELARADVERAAIGAQLDVRRLRALAAPRRRNALRYWIAQAGHAVPDTARLALLSGPVLEARRDAKPQVCWSGVCAIRHADQLRLVAERGEPALESIQWTLQNGLGVLELGGVRGRLELAPDEHGRVDLDALPEHLTVRARWGGERLRPRIGGPRRTLKSLLQQSGWPPELRAHVPLLTDAEHVLAAGDLWLDASIQLGPRTRRRGRLVWHRDRRLC